MAEIVVVGSLNLDTTALVDTLPRPGETVMGTGHHTDTGGKGANQAVAAARLGRRVAMVGRVGADAGGRRLRDTLDREGIDVAGVTEDAAVPTGSAFITVDASGENMIVVSPGANARVSPSDVERSADVIVAARVLLLQLEIPLETVQSAAALCQGIVVLNPAPAQPLPTSLLETVEILVPNRTELATLTGSPVAETFEDIRAQVRQLPVSVGVVTLGADGALVMEAGAVTHVVAPQITAVDATAAGDAFCGALGDAVAGGAAPVDATRWAVRAGAVAASRPGAQSSLPSRAEVVAQ